MNYPTKEINQYACSAGCYGAFRWQGMTTNGGCRCLGQVKDLDTKRQIKLFIKEYQNRIQELECEVLDLKDRPDLTTVFKG